MMLFNDKKRAPWTAADVEAIRTSGLFDAEFYQARRGQSCPDPIADYLREGERNGIAPSALFDPVYYRLSNADVAEQGMSPLLHYIRYGWMEGRRPTRFGRPALPKGVSGKAAQKSGRKVRERGGLAGLKWLLRLVRSDRAVDENRFDEQFYFQAYPDVRTSGRSPAVHYDDVGTRQHRLTNRHQMAAAVSELRPHFNARHYRQQAQLSSNQIDPIEHYLTVGRFLGYDPSPDFSVRYYLRAYPDIAQNGIDPFTHYVRFGKRERRLGQPSFLKGRIQGAKRYDPSRQTVLIVNHDASRTGAPLVGLEAGRHLSKDHNVLIYSQREGELIEAFSDISVQVNVGAVSTADAEFFIEHLRRDYSIDAVVVNSAETAPFAGAVTYAGVPSVALIHEFAEYTLPPGKAARMAAAVDRVIVPAELILQSLQRDLRTQFGSEALHIAVRPQGCLPDLPGRTTQDTERDLSEEEILGRLCASESRPPIVLGAGFVHMRKGVELFVQTAHEVRRSIPDVRFVWVGTGYEPKRDVAYSVWLSETIRRLDLEKTVFFLPPQSDLDRIFALSSVFFLSSRMDPFPNVVLDAFEAGKQVVCFDKATGAAELFKSGAARGAAVEYGNVGEAARAIVGIINSDSREASEINRRLVDQQFRFEDYVTFLKGAMATAQQRQTQVQKATERVLASNAFDADFHEGSIVLGGDQKRACLDYVSRHLKGLSKFSPRPGFSDNVYRSRFETAPGTVPLEHALKSGGAHSLVTHRCVELPRESAPPPSLRIALHLHLHYPDLAEDFLRRLAAAACPIDLFVTTTSSEKRVFLQEAFSSYENGTASYFEVKNQGRDIGPFLTELGSVLKHGNYDVVGHLHGKRSLAVDQAMGDRWRRYLLQFLLGENLSQLLHLFSEDERLGLVFAEDRHVVGWDGNYDLAKQVAARMSPSPALPAFPYFPLGTMFWARRAALEPLWSANFKTSEFPVEPLAYDGTVLHAIERILPSCVEAAGYSWCTVYDRGSTW